MYLFCSRGLLPLQDVAINEDGIIAVGSKQTYYAGLVFLYQYDSVNGVTALATISPPSAGDAGVTYAPQNGACFGCAIAIDGNTLAVGAQFLTSTETNDGGAFVYDITGGVPTLEAQLLTPVAYDGGHVGYSIAIQVCVLWIDF